MASDDKPYIGIDLGGTNIQAAVVDPKHQVLARASTKTKAEEGADTVIKRIVKLAGGVTEEAGLTLGEIGGLGIGAPGAIDIENGVVITAVNLRWTDFPLAKVLGKALDLPIVVDNDVNVGAWGEHVAGAGRGFDDMLAIFVGTGVGGGLILGGRLYHGARHTAGEIGHTIIDADAAVGRRSVEHLASRTSMVQLITKLIEAHRPSVITELTGGDLTKVRSRVLSQALKKKDPVATEVIHHAARYIGVAIANTVTLLSLPCVVVGGGVTEALDSSWLKQVRASFEQHVFPETLRDCKIVPSVLEDDAGPIGAASLARLRQAQP